MPRPLIQPVLLCGGAGQRLWPLSPPEKPKPLLPLVGERTMLQLTAARVNDRTRYGAPIIVGGAPQARPVHARLVQPRSAPALMIFPIRHAAGNESVCH